MTRSLSDLTQALLDRARKNGADTADAIAVDGTSIQIGVRGGALEQAERSEGIEIGLRVMVGQRQACVSSSDVKDSTLEQMAARAVTMAREAPEDSHIGLADPSQLSRARDAAGLELHEDADEPHPDTLREDARTAEAAALAVDGVSKVQSASAGYSRRRIHLSATNGFEGGYTRTEHGLSCLAISGEGTGMERDYDYDSRTHAADMRDAAEIGRIAGERAAALRNMRRPKTGAYPVIYDERIAGGLIGHLLMAANGSAVARGASWLRDRLGQRVLPAGLSLTEDPHRPRSPASRLFDAEGLATGPRDIVRDGILQGWTLDLATARKLDMAPTANAARGISAPPSPGLTNVALTQSDRSREDLMAEMGTGLLITSMIGSTINPNSGDYSRGASGFWIENGEIAYPVNECTVAGNLLDMLQQIVPANDARAHLTRVVPSLLVEGLTLAGE